MNKNSRVSDHLFPNGPPLDGGGGGGNGREPAVKVCSGLGGGTGTCILRAPPGGGRGRECRPDNPDAALSCLGALAGRLTGAKGSSSATPSSSRSSTET